MKTHVASLPVLATLIVAASSALVSGAAFAGVPPSTSTDGSAAQSKAPIAFTPAVAPIPDDEFGKVVREGREIFDDPAKYASQYVGSNLMRCTSCHLDEGRQPGAAPMWAAYGAYPAYRSKNHHVNTFEERLQGCFRFSMNGKAPPFNDPVLVALESYSYWMSKGAPIDEKLKGRGYPKLAKPASPPDYQRGAQIYAQDCALCHGSHGEGRVARDGQPDFPALWGAESFNWGAGMGSITNAAAFIRANMPRGRGGMLSEQEAWDVATFMDSQERPQDPRYTGSVADTRAKYHNGASSMYGKVVNGHLLGSDSEASGGRLRQSMSP